VTKIKGFIVFDKYYTVHNLLQKVVEQNSFTKIQSKRFPKNRSTIKL